MEPIEIIAQVIGIIAMAFNILSYQPKNKNTILAMQLCGGVLFATNYLLLGAIVGGLINIISVIRAILFLFRDKLKTDRIGWFIPFFATYIGIYILNFTVLGVEPTLANFFIELLPVIGATALHIGFCLKNSADVRKCGLVSSPSWLIYNVVAGSWGATLCEIFTLGSIFIGMLRHDKKQ